jgi:hypothetical protein
MSTRPHVLGSFFEAFELRFSDLRFEGVSASSGTVGSRPDGVFERSRIKNVRGFFGVLDLLRVRFDFEGERPRRGKGIFRKEIS